MDQNEELQRLYLELYALNTGWFKGNAYVSRDWAAANQTITRRIRDILKEQGVERLNAHDVIDQYKHNPAD